MALKALHGIRCSLVDRLGRLFDSGYDLSSPIVVEISEILDEVIHEIMKQEHQYTSDSTMLNAAYQPARAYPQKSSHTKVS